MIKNFKSEKYDITPTPKPRMTRADKWKKRACVVKYWEFRDKCQELDMQVPVSGAHVIFLMPIPKNRMKHNLQGIPHQQRPDIDNLIKAVLDAIYQDDCVVHDIRASKVWSDQPGIIINLTNWD